MVVNHQSWWIKYSAKIDYWIMVGNPAASAENNFGIWWNTKTILTILLMGKYNGFVMNYHYDGFVIFPSRIDMMLTAAYPKHILKYIWEGALLRYKNNPFAFMAEPEKIIYPLFNQAIFSLWHFIEAYTKPTTDGIIHH